MINMLKTTFFKYHAIGNDYIVLDPKTFSLTLTRNIIQMLCHRNFGIGGNGILYGPIHYENNLCLKIYNPNGSEAENSGNGVRIFALYLLQQNYIANDLFNINTKSGTIKINILNRKKKIIRTYLELFSFASNLIPTLFKQKIALNIKLNIDGYKGIIHCVNVGNPHCVLIKDNISKNMIEKLGPIFESHNNFPNAINVQIMQIIDWKTIKIEIWERGVGYTLSSGTSSMATFCVAYKLGLVGEEVRVIMAGGSVLVKMEKGDKISLVGTASLIGKGQLSDEFISQHLK